MIPERKIFTISDVSKWEKSQAYRDYVGLILFLNEAVKNKPNKTECHTSDITNGILKLLDRLNVFVDETPPIDQPQRFGNKAFRIWMEKVTNEAQSLLKEALPEKFHSFIPEIRAYIIESFGNSTRIDYGSGHEMAFLMFLCCLFKIEAFLAEDQTAVVLKVFNSYIDLVRRLQITYRMEPAGSHGVWSLDDFQFVPFIFGSSQLMDNERIRPKSFINEDVVLACAKDYMFLGCIKYILEVLAKFPVVQHILFGDLLSIEEAPKSNNL
ncbi:serine/threonine-protein phosphatase 2A activator-like isoform X2 [Artemia franciscana]|uniref:serine/threonine-protein phosphatase 2A activator-like isoform X2 n=1 Tax=Artemia franciscana TaxID=6661 RepID=UPI0032DBA71A